MMATRSHAPVNGASDAMLAIDASTAEGSVAVIRGGVVAAERTVAMRGEDEERLMPAVAAVLGETGTRAGELAHIVCGAGPGSFTSLRIAASIAKGMAMATGATLFAVSSLELAAVEALGGGTGERGNGRTDLPVVVALDALRGDVFFGAYEWNGAALVQMRPTGLTRREEAASIAASLGATFVDARPHARGVAKLLRAVLGAGPVDLATWEPDYGRKAEAQVRWEAAHGRPLAP